jgi:hypothetical protein
MFEAKQLQKHALECLRLQADCMQLAGVARSLTCAIAFRFHSAILGHLGGFGAEFGCRLETFQS